jgi:hypothetical protein
MADSAAPTKRDREIVPSDPNDPGAGDAPGGRRSSTRVSHLLEDIDSPAPPAGDDSPPTLAQAGGDESLVEIERRLSTVGIEGPRRKSTSPEYDEYWEVDGAFSEEGFANNFLHPRKCVDVAWVVLFYLNLAATLMLFILSKPWEEGSYRPDTSGFDRKAMVMIGIICVGIAAGAYILTYMFVWWCPRAFMKCSVSIGMAFLLCAMVPLAIVFTPLILLFTICIFLLGCCFYICVCRRMDFSADVLQSACVILKKFPTIAFLNLVIFLIQAGMSYIFSCGAILIFCLKIHYAVYVYLVFSYFWIQSTLSFILYQTCAGVASAWYYLNGTKFMPSHPIFFSLGHTLTTGFGPVAIAGLLDGINQALDWLQDNAEKLTCGLGAVCFCCFKCCCRCCCFIFDCVIGAINRYSLIYCAMFGVPATEGVKRWGDVSSRKIIDMIVNSTVISKTFRFYSYVAGAAGASIGGLVGWLLWDKSDARFIFVFAFSGTCAASGLFLIGNPLEVISDALFVGFAEAPQRMETGANEIYVLFKGKAKDLIDEEIDRAKHPEKYADEHKCPCCACCCCC